MKKLTSLILCAFFVLSCAVPASAALEYTYIDTIHSTLRFDTLWNLAECSGTVESVNDNEMQIEVTLQVESDNGWKDLKTWTNTGEYCVTASGYYAVASGKQYRLYVTAYVYNDSGRIVESGTQTQTKYF